MMQDREKRETLGEKQVPDPEGFHGRQRTAAHETGHGADATPLSASSRPDPRPSSGREPELESEAGPSSRGGKGCTSFPREFWLANIVELLERAAHYGFFVVLTLYLTTVVGFTDSETGYVGGLFFAGLYLLPLFTGAMVDRIGFKRGLMLAFGMLTVGYLLLGLVYSKVMVVTVLGLVMIGGSFIKPLISGTVAKTTSEANRARGYSVFYQAVNIGAFGGKLLVPYLRQGVGLQYVSLFSAVTAFVALITVILLFKEERLSATTESKTMGELFRALGRILKHPRLMALTVIVAGFWTIQHQLYATMPKYVIRMVGEGAKPEWLANVNPVVVVLCVTVVTRMMRKRQAVLSMLVGMMLMPLSAMTMSLGPVLQRIVGADSVGFGLFALHPLTVMMVVGIGIQGVAECFISPRFLEYFSLHAPKGQEGTYLGVSYLRSFISALVGFFMSGHLLDKYCPDPKTLPQGISEAQKAAYYANAHHIWYYFAAIGFVSALCLLIFWVVTKRIDSKAKLTVV